MEKMRNMKKILVSGFLAMAIGLPLTTRANEATPDGLIQDTVNDVLTIVNNDKAIVSNQKRLLELVDAKILPHFDFMRMTQLAVGKTWRTTTDDQKKELTAEFRTLLVRTYTRVFKTYPDPVIEVKPVKPGTDADEATVRTVIHIKDGKSATVDYEMKKSKDGWKVFDVTVEGVSLVTSYRGSFADQIQQSGVEGLIKALVEKNQSAGKTDTQKKVQAN